ncbi:MAG: transporter [Thalassotalea sp.]|nr:transporter [Thalassotalea sp.]
MVSMHVTEIKSSIRTNIVVFCTLLLCSNATYAEIGDGPRAYFPPPIDTNVFTVFGMKVEGNSMLNSGIVNPGLELDVDLVIAQYTRTMSINDRYVSFTVVQPTGDLTSTITLPNAPDFQNQTKSDGLGDTQLLLSMGLYNLPPLTKETYASYKPEFAIGGLARLTLPTGEYDENKSANLGANRYSLQLGAPITFGFGYSFLDPHLTTFDLVPSVTFFGDNDEPFGADTISQDPLYKLEAHLTHNFNPAIWTSLDGIYAYGGETETDGVSGDNKQRSLNMGATLGVQFSKSLGLKLSYGKTIDRNDDGVDGEFARLMLVYTQL